MKSEFNFGPWLIEYMLNDGARLSRISYKGHDLLTKVPLAFRAPEKELGLYEHRPVYGYDDCFPSVVACDFPELDITIPDHGEVCWLDWKLSKKPNSLIFCVKSKLLPVVFKREMIFNDSSILWNFEVSNIGNKILPFQHSMHPLIKIVEIKDIKLPQFESAFDWNTKHDIDSSDPKKISEFLLSRPDGAVEMLFIRNIKNGNLSWKYNSGITLNMVFPAKYFPTIGIWWNKNGYPDENGIHRNECAFEPIAGYTSVLTQAYADGNCLSVKPKEQFGWQILWRIQS